MDEHDVQRAASHSTRPGNESRAASNETSHVPVRRSRLLRFRPPLEVGIFLCIALASNTASRSCRRQYQRCELTVLRGARFATTRRRTRCTARHCSCRALHAESTCSMSSTPIPGREATPATRRRFVARNGSGDISANVNPLVAPRSDRDATRATRAPNRRPQQPA